MSRPIHVDFHPTDVLMDADGSLLVIDTGGWYKLCCPTSQLWKPDVLGGIYRVRPYRRPARRRPAWPENSLVESECRTIVGVTIGWPSGGAAASQPKPGAAARIAGRATSSSHIWRSSACVVFLSTSQQQTRTQATRRRPRWHDLWTLCQIDSAVARQCIRQHLGHEVESIRHAALNAVSLNRDRKAASQVVELSVSRIRRPIVAPRRKRWAASAIKPPYHICWRQPLRPMTASCSIR